MLGDLKEILLSCVNSDNNHHLLCRFCNCLRSSHVLPQFRTFKPSAIRPRARTMNVVEPSPTRSLVFAPTCLTNFTSRFSKGSASSIYLEQVEWKQSMELKTKEKTVVHKLFNPYYNIFQLVF